MSDKATRSPRVRDFILVLIGVNFINAVHLAADGSWLCAVLAVWLVWATHNVGWWPR